ncbi:MAG: mycolipenoyl-CoA---2-(long-chain-fatty acyl)-trehalose mycolipenoyltransferase, partial [Mycobacterium sp.]|nr:mycolipenoyl-CoA---2-(long-chain-fatty acyl)-trehalose mycolipenoyltransferase [Mycobacterium sp.]
MSPRALWDGRRPSREDVLRIGKLAIGSIDDWTLSPGEVTSWQATTAAQEKARQAPVSSVPVSYMQAQHLRGHFRQIAAGLDYSRQIIATCEVPGQCDVSAMTQALNAYLRRHDTYRSWFEYSGSGDVIRRTMSDPADVEFEPTNHGEMAVDDLYKHIVAIPTPLEWGCFTFGIV